MIPMNEEDTKARAHILKTVQDSIEHAETLRCLIYDRRAVAFVAATEALTQYLRTLKADLKRFRDDEGDVTLRTMLLNMAQLNGAAQMCYVFVKSTRKGGARGA